MNPSENKPLTNGAPVPPRPDIAPPAGPRPIAVTDVNAPAPTEASSTQPPELANIEQTLQAAAAESSANPIAAADATPVTVAQATPPTPAQPTSATDQPAGIPSAPAAMSTPPAAEPAATPGNIIVGSDSSGPTSFTPPSGGAQLGKSPHRRQKWWLGGSLVVLVLLLAAGWVFGLYLPNQPDNVWKTGLSRSGMALDKLATTAINQRKSTHPTTSGLKGTLSYSSQDFNASGDFNLTADQTNTKAGLDATLKPAGQPDIDLKANLLTTLPKGAALPDEYIQLTGLKVLGLDALIPNIDALDGQWIGISGKYMQSLLDEDGTAVSTTGLQNITADDYTAAIQAEIATSRDYIFTTDPTKAVLVNKGFVGKEIVEGVKSYHYTVAINKDHAKAYCTAAVKTLSGTEVYKKLVADNARASTADSITKGCQSSVDNVKPGDTFDIWIGGKYKLIHMVRIHDAADANSYVDFGETYTGGDSMNWFTKLHDPSDKSSADFTATTDFKKLTSNGKLTVGGDGYTVALTFTTDTSNKPVTVTPPAKFVPVQNVLQQLGL